MTVCFSPHLPQYFAATPTLFLHRGQILSPTPPVAGETDSDGLLVEDSLSEEGVDGVEDGVVDGVEDGVDIGVEYGEVNGEDEGVVEGVVDSEEEGVEGTEASDALAAEDLVGGTPGRGLRVERRSTPRGGGSGAFSSSGMNISGGKSDN